MKGQTAVEYLMTYGWAILIILIVAGVLAYYGIFAPSGFLAPTARGFGELQVRSPWSLTTDNIITLDVENRVGQTINMHDIYVSVAGSGGDKCTTGPTDSLASGTHKIITCTIGSGLTGGTSGAQYTASIAIEYETAATTGTYFNSTGTISGTY